MDNIISITNTKENFIEFDISIDGINGQSDILVHFVIETNEMNIEFKCDKKDDKTWNATIPPIPFVERTTYPFHIEVIADGYYFEPFNGHVDIVGPVDLYVSRPRNTTLEPPKNEDSNKTDRQEKQNSEVEKIASKIQTSTETNNSNTNKEDSEKEKSKISKNELIKSLISQTRSRE